MKEIRKCCLVILITFIFIITGCDNCKTYYIPVEHAKEYMNMDINNYKEITYKRSNNKTFKAIIYKVCK